jgi:Cu-processing system ATP-binding protein
MTDTGSADGATEADPTDGARETDSADGVREPLLVGENLTRRFGDVLALSDVSVSVDPGEVTAFVGPNGSGKTTLLRVLAGLLDPTGGSVTYSGPESRRRIGYLPQQPAFRPRFTVRETLAFYAGLVDDDPDRLLDRVGLDAVADRRIGALSGGMTRLLGVGQALAGEPPVVALDEPGSSLDPAMSERVFDVAADIAAEAGRGVLLCSHDLALVERVADAVVVLDRGDVVATGSPATLHEKWGGPLVDTFGSAIEGDPSVIATHKGEDE